MKYLSSWKGMKKSTKVGLVTSAVYAASALALPVFANQVTEKPVVQSLDLEKLSLEEQSNSLYKTKLAEYAEDKKITVDEITQLVKIKKGDSSIITKQINSLMNKKIGFMRKAYELDDERRNYNDKVIILDNQLQHPDIKKSLEKNLDQFEKEILAYYPGLITIEGKDLIYSSEIKLLYSSETELKFPLDKAFNKIVKETHNLLRDHYGDESMFIFLDNGDTLREVVVFYETLKNKISSIKKDGRKNDALLLEEKQSLVVKIKDLESKRDLIINSDNVRQLEDKIRQLDDKLSQIDKSYVHLSEYLSVHEDFARFKKENKRDFSRYFTIAFTEILLGNYGMPDYMRMGKYDYDRKKLVFDVESYFKAEGFDVKVVDKLRNPAKTRWNLWWSVPLALFGPMLRNALLLKYLGGGKQTEDDYGGSVSIGFAEGFIFNFGYLDSIHPLVFPIRMAAIPLLWHGILKATGGDKKLYDYAK